MFNFVLRFPFSLQAEEQRLREEHVRFQDQQSRLHSRRQEEVLTQTEHAKGEVKSLAIAKKKELDKKEVGLISSAV